MEQRQLLNFLSVCEERNITRAAERRFITQQGLSRSIRDLEDELGAPLFDRSRRGVELTEFGQILEKAARSWINQHDYIIETIRAAKEKSALKLSIGLIDGIHHIHFPGLFSGFIARHPDISISVKTFPIDKCLQYVLEQRLQLGFSVPPIDTDVFDSYLIQKKKMFLLVGNKHPLAGRASVRLGELRGYTIINYANNMHPQPLLLELCRQNSLDLDIQLGSPERALIAELCAPTRFVCFCAGEINYMGNLVRIEIEDASLFIELYLIANKRAYINQAAEIFIAYVREHMVSLDV
jgi:DNA-binding transcriptional LysR family regulator